MFRAHVEISVFRAVLVIVWIHIGVRFVSLVTCFIRDGCVLVSGYFDSQEC